MFMTLLKHEWRATKGILGLLCLIILGSGTAMGGSCWFLTLEPEAFQAEIWNILAMIMFMTAFVVIPVCCAGGLFYLIWRFYQSRFTDEGYLTFTLPVTTHQNLLSSIVNILWGCVLVLLAAACAMAIFLALMVWRCNDMIIWGDVWRELPEIWDSFVSMWNNSWQNILWALAAVVSTGISKVILMMLAVTVGSILAKKHKILTAVGAYWAIGLVKNILYANVLIMSDSEKWSIQFPFFTGLVLSVAGYFVMHYLVDKKLNLN